MRRFHDFLEYSKEGRAGKTAFYSDEEGVLGYGILKKGREASFCFAPEEKGSEE